MAVSKAMEIKFITSNKAKIAAARMVFGEYGISVKQRKAGIEELQHIDVKTVAIHKAKEVLKAFGSMFLVEDSGLYVDAWNGFPGALLKPTIDAVGEGGLLDMLNGKRRTATFMCVAVLYRPRIGFRTFEFPVKGTLSRELRGRKIEGWAVDRLFVPDSYRKTIAEMSLPEYEEYIKGSNSHYGKVARYLMHRRT